ncbi:restriction endonuclease subunit S [Nocardiopsis sp. NRRL B-16309]|uniref:restriction endonuclease subunit S n=1 Tax=Nocardiopsis sp. NRRL B-16309 TaxID=1519494 RepID=UPI0009E7CF55|nr:restriction endonuclease subunit S [Nocardiopsis sp. NRRL B-16309]
MTLRTTTLGDLTTINPKHEKGTTPDTPVSFVGMSDVDAKSASVTHEEIRSFEETSKGFTRFKKGDILLAKITPCFENGKIAQATISESLGSGSTEFHVIRAHEASADPRFLLHMLRHPKVLFDGERKMTGSSGHRRVPESYVASIAIPNYPLETQGKIGEALDTLESLRAMRRNSLELLDELAQSIFLDMFGDPIRNTKDWGTEKLGDLARIIRGASPRPKGDPRYFGGPIPWLMISDVTRTQGNTVTNIREGVTEAGRDKSVYLPKGSLILTNSATVGVPKFLGVDSCIHDGFLGILDISPKINKEYLYNLFLLNRERISQMAPEGTQKNLNTGIAKSLEIPIPPIEKQDAFVERIRQISLLRESHQSHLAHLDELFASVQQRAFDGALWDDRDIAS